MTIADRIANRRTELGYSQEDLAKKCGWSNRSSISQIESAKDHISLKKIQKIAKALEVSPSWLMGMDDSLVIYSNYPELIGEEKITTSEEIKKIRDVKTKRPGKRKKKEDKPLTSTMNLTDPLLDSTIIYSKNTNVSNNTYKDVKKSIPYLSNAELDALEKYISLVRSERVLESKRLEIEAEKDMHDADLFLQALKHQLPNDYNDYD